MLDRVRRVLAGPVFEGDEEKTRVAALLNIILLGALTLELLSSIASPFTNPDPRPTWAINGFLAAIQVGMLIAIWRGHVRAMTLLLSTVLWLVVLGITVGYSGINGPGPVLFVVVITIASLLSGGRVGLIFGGLSIAAVLAVGHAETAGWITVDPAVITPAAMASTLIATFFLSALLIFLTTRSLSRLLVRARQNEQAQAAANRELQALRESLERRVEERTSDLARRSAYLQASAEIGRTAAILDVERLIRQAVESIHQRFELYHVAVFTLDERGAWLELRGDAGSGAALLDPALRLSVKRNTLAGWCVANTEVQLRQDVRTTAELDDVMLLPGTRSAAAWPLVARNHVLGVLSAQSDQVGGFPEAMVRALGTLADQIAVGLDNARLFAASQAALEAERRAYGEFERAAWAQLLRARLAPGYSYADKQLTPLAESSAADGPTMAVPIIIRGQTIGVVELAREDAAAPWTAAEMGLLETLTEQLGAALDSARLYQDTQRRAARERLTGEITARMRESLELDRILQAVVREISGELGVETEVWLGEAALEL